MPAHRMLAPRGLHGLVDDVAQETFIRAHGALARFDDGRPLRPWLLSIAANLARNRRRSLGRYWDGAAKCVPRTWRSPP